MKRIVSLLFAVAIASTNLLAQGPLVEKGLRPQKSPEERAELITKRMTKELSLNSDQEAKIKGITLKRIQERDAMMKERKKNRDEADNEIKSILTPDQYKTFLQNKDEMRKKREKRKMQPPPPPGNGEGRPPLEQK